MGWAEARLTAQEAGELIALGEGLVAIGRLRTGTSSGQISMHNFQVRAGEEEAGEGETERALVVLMRAGVFRRHTFFCRYRQGAGDGARLELPGPIDRGWAWRASFEEVRDRLIEQPVWDEAVGRPFAERAREVATALAQGALVRLGDEAAAPRI